jgi:hypothetical protein
VFGSNFLLNLEDINRVFSKVRKTQHQNLEFRPKLGEIKGGKKIKKHLQKSTLAFKGGGG